MKQRAILVDIDGTLAHRGERYPHDLKKVGEDEPDEMVIEAVRLFASTKKYKIIVVSGRKASCERMTWLWLTLHGVPFDDLMMRDNDDDRPDNEVKRDIYVNSIFPDYEVDLVIDDRAQVVAMWREMGLTCWQVAEGNF